MKKTTKKRRGLPYFITEPETIAALEQLRETLSGQLRVAELHTLAEHWQEAENDVLHGAFYWLIDDEDARVSVNAMRMFLFVARQNMEWLHGAWQQLSDRIPFAPTSVHRRLLLSYLDFFPGTFTDWHAGLFNWCLKQVLSEAEPPAVRALCIKIAARMCHPQAALSAEMRVVLEQLAELPHPPSVASARRQAMRILINAEEWRNG